MLGHLAALVAAIIWAYSILVYKDFSIEENPLVINIWRLIASSTFLILVCILTVGFNPSIGYLYAALSGILVLALGDSLYFYGSVYAGAAVAAPIVYTYIILIQLTSVIVGEELTLNKIVASVMCFFAIFLLTRKKRTIRRKDQFSKGILCSIGSVILWVIGQTVLKPAVILSSFLEVTFIRSLFGLLTLVVLAYFLKLNVKVFEKRKQSKLFSFGILDIGIGALLYIFAISKIGLGNTVILASISPLLTQFFASITGRERVTLLEIFSAIIVSLAVTICVI